MVSVGISVGILVGAAVSYQNTGRFTPGVLIGAEFGFALALLVGLYIDGKTNSRSKRLFIILICTYLAIGALVLAIVRS
jgi:H+/Cl- antiporter ClcA